MTGTLPHRDGTCGLGERRDIRGETPPFRGVSRLSRLVARVPFDGVPMSRLGLARNVNQGDDQ